MQGGYRGDTKRASDEVDVGSSAVDSGGKGGIRTPGASQLIGFQDRRDRPLCHLSECKSMTDFRFHQIFYTLFYAACIVALMSENVSQMFAVSKKKINFTLPTKIITLSTSIV